MKKSEVKIFSLGANDNLSREICKFLNIKLSPIVINNFSDGEQYIKLDDNCRGKHVFLIQSTNQPDSNFIRLVLAIDAARRASAKEITVVVPYYGYSRQERKSEARTPISARVFANIIEGMGADRIVTMDLHAPAIEGFFFKTKVDHLYSRPVFIQKLKKTLSKEIVNNEVVVVAPDTGAANRARSFSLRLLKHNDLAIISKGREKANQISSMELVGDVSEKIVVLVDDMADTCSTIAKAAGLLKQKGAKKVIAVVTHGIFSGDSIKKLEESEIDRFYVTNSIEIGGINNNLSKNIEIVSVAELFAECIKRIYTNGSVSELFTD